MIRALAEKDLQFCLPLQEDLVFRDMFWYRTRFGHNWTAKSTEEEVARTFIDNAIADRIELVLAQKTQLKKYFHLLNDSEKTGLSRQMNTEVGFMPQWLAKDMPNYDEIRDKCFDALDLEFVDPNPQAL